MRGLLLLMLVSPAHAGLLDLDGMTSLVAAAAKSAKVGMTVDLQGTREAAYYVGFKPSWGLINTELCLGATAKTLQGSYEMLVAPLYNFKPLVDRLFTAPFQLPDIWVGLAFRTPSPGIPYVIGHAVTGMLSIRALGGGQ